MKIIDKCEEDPCTVTITGTFEFTSEHFSKSLTSNEAALLELMHYTFGCMRIDEFESYKMFKIDQVVITE